MQSPGRKIRRRSHLDGDLEASSSSSDLAQAGGSSSASGLDKPLPPGRRKFVSPLHNIGTLCATAVQRCYTADYGIEDDSTVVGRTTEQREVEIG